MYRWNIETHNLPLKFTWKISRGESQEKTLYFVKVTDGVHEALGEVAGITTDKDKAEQLIEQFESFKKKDLKSLEEILSLKLPSHMEFGITSALVHLQAQQAKQSLWQFLGLREPQPLSTSFSLPILPLNEVEGFVKKYELQRFQVLKLKISQDNPVASCQTLAKLYSGPIRIDANEAFTKASQVLNFLDQIKGLNIEFVEEPLPRGSINEYIVLKNKSPFPIFADESVQQDLLPESIKDQFHGINVKLMKAGSYQRARQQIDQAKQWGLKVMLGCMVESSLGIAGGLCISQDVDYFDLDGFLYFKDEPFAYVKEENGKLSLKEKISFP